VVNQSRPESLHKTMVELLLKYSSMTVRHQGTPVRTLVIRLEVIAQPYTSFGPNTSSVSPASYLCQGGNVDPDVR